MSDMTCDEEKNTKITLSADFVNSCNCFYKAQWTQDKAFKHYNTAVSNIIISWK